MELENILDSKDLELIANLISPEIVKEHLGEDSDEYESYEQYLKKEVYQQYKIPKRTESPATTAGMARNWIIEFHRLNKMDLPKGFHQKTKKQLLGMYFGMLRDYGIDEDQIVIREELEMYR